MKNAATLSAASAPHTSAATAAVGCAGIGTGVSAGDGTGVGGTGVGLGDGTGVGGTGAGFGVGGGVGTGVGGTGVGGTGVGGTGVGFGVGVLHFVHAWHVRPTLSVQSLWMYLPEGHVVSHAVHWALPPVPYSPVVQTLQPQSGPYALAVPALSVPGAHAQSLHALPSVE
jgi:hypothetical protein